MPSVLGGNTPILASVSISVPHFCCRSETDLGSSASALTSGESQSSSDAICVPPGTDCLYGSMLWPEHSTQRSADQGGTLHHNAGKKGDW